MIQSRTGYWIAVILACAIWLGALTLGGRDFALDLAIYRALYLHAGTALARDAIVFTEVGWGLVLILLTVAAAAYLFVRRKRRAALLLIMVFGGRFLVELQKIIIDRPRPGVSPHLVAVNSYSFPSGHAANAMITFLAIGLLLPVRQRNRAVAGGNGQREIGSRAEEEHATRDESGFTRVGAKDKAKQANRPRRNG